MRDFAAKGFANYLWNLVSGIVTANRIEWATESDR